jgi:hypothetical protein
MGISDDKNHRSEELLINRIFILLAENVFWWRDFLTLLESFGLSKSL